MSKNKEKRRRIGIAEYLSVKAELPSDVLAGEVRIELRGRNLIFISGCRRIIKYSPENIILSIKGDDLSIFGDRLICTSYHGGTVSVEGHISGVSFEKGETE